MWPICKHYGAKWNITPNLSALLGKCNMKVITSGIPLSILGYCYWIIFSFHCIMINMLIKIVIVLSCILSTTLLIALNVKAVKAVRYVHNTNRLYNEFLYQQYGLIKFLMLLSFLILSYYYKTPVLCIISRTTILHTDHPFLKYILLYSQINYFDNWHSLINSD